MSNHFQVLLEVPPVPVGGIPDDELFKPLGAFYSEVQLAEIAKEMEEAAAVRRRGEFEHGEDAALSGEVFHGRRGDR